MGMLCMFKLTSQNTSTREVITMTKGKGGKGSMNSKSASRIQSHADRTGSNQGFKSRAQRASSKNSK